MSRKYYVRVEIPAKFYLSLHETNSIFGSSDPMLLSAKMRKSYIMKFALHEIIGVVRDGLAKVSTELFWDIEIVDFEDSMGYSARIETIASFEYSPDNSYDIYQIFGQDNNSQFVFDSLSPEDKKGKNEYGIKCFLTFVLKSSMAGSTLIKSVSL